MSALTLHVSNLSQLPQSVDRSYRFGRDGGTLGSQGADWILIDRHLSVQPIHCEIRWTEGGFCVIDHSGRTYLNGSTHALGSGQPMRLKDGDILQVGTYRLRVDLQSEALNQLPLGEVFRPSQTVHEALEASASISPTVNAIDTFPPLTVEVCSAFDPLPGHDPLVALDAKLSACPSDQNPLQDLITGPRPCSHA